MAQDKTVTTTGLMGWVDERFPATKLWKEHLSEYYAPKNFNFWYFFGSLAMLVLVIQIVTGIFLVMHYKPDAAKAFDSVEYIMRDVPWGWLVRYMHATGASAFFVVIYLHMFRGLMYGSYRKPRELIWIFGCLIFLCLMGEAFFGYLLPWGQMSYWGAQVIVNLFSAIPFIGPDLSILIRGDFVVSDATLNRFFSFHVIAIPLVLLGLVAAHIVALHEVGSNNPDGIDIKKNKNADGIPRDGIPFHPYYTVHDIVGVIGFLFIFSAIVFFAPEMGGYFIEYNNFIPADPLKTPAHIAPVWYFTPFYSILRATTSEFLHVIAIFLVVWLVLLWFSRAHGLAKLIGTVCVAGYVGSYMAFPDLFSAKFWGVVAMGASVMVFFALPWIDNSPARSMRYRPAWHMWFLLFFVVAFVVLGYFGVQAPSPVGERLSQFFTLVYFGFFMFMPWWSQMGTFKPVPERVTFQPH